MRNNQLSDHREVRYGALGDLLKSRREAAGLTLHEMATKLGISRQYLGRLERGEYMHPAPEILFRIVKCLNVSSEDLYALTGLLPMTDLPSLAPYLRAKHPDWPDAVIAELDDFCNYLKHKYSLR
jgi:transcriptional regulator with XRE-family HTH domain